MHEQTIILPTLIFTAVKATLENEDDMSGSLRGLHQSASDLLDESP
jgi:hypothetical protein